MRALAAACACLLVVWNGPAAAQNTPPLATSSVADRAATSSPADGDVLQAHLEELLLKGSYEEVLKHPQGDTPSHHVAILRAKAAKGWFLEYVEDHRLISESPSPGQTAELKSRAHLATQCFEEAARLSPTRFDRMCVAADWRILHTHARFSDDSEYLRDSDAPLPVAGGTSSTLVARALRACAAGVAEISPMTATCPPSTAALAVDEIERAYAEMAPDTVPETVYLGIVRGLPQFVIFAMPDLRETGDDTVRQSIRWYVWVAIVQPQPSQAERQLLDAQVKVHAERIKSEFAKIFGEEGTPAGDEYAERFLALYERTKNNRLVPYFKQAVAPYQARSNDRAIAAALDEISAAVAAKGTELKERNKALEAAEQRRLYDEEMANLQQTLYYELLSGFIRFSRPIASYPLPHRVTRTATAKTNQFGVWAFTIESCPPVPALGTPEGEDGGASVKGTGE